MDKKSFLNLAGNLFNEVKDNIIQTGKDKLKETVDELVDKGKDAVQNAVEEKTHNFTNGFFGKKSTGTSTKINFGTKKPEIHNADFSEEKYLDSDNFEKNLHSGLNGLVAGFASGNPAEAAKVLGDLVNMAGDVAKFTEVQKTMRKGIEAERDVAISKINAQKEWILLYLEKSFDERKENFSKLFAIVDDAIAKDNMQQLAISLESINQLAASSPFKALASNESTKKALTDQNHVWDF